jgi:FlaA1/EpsC-like NDP-sugar epimerase
MRRRIRSASVPVHRHSLPQLLVDGALVALAYYLAYLLRFDERGIPAPYQRLFEVTIGPVVAGSLIVFALFGLYHKWWRYAGPRDFAAILRAVVATTLLTVGAIDVLHPVTAPTARGLVGVGLPGGVIALQLLITLVALTAARALVRAALERPRRGVGGRALLVVGAGEGGRLVLREVFRNPGLGYHPVGLVDDDPRKRGMRLDGVQVHGPTTDLPRILDDTEPQEVIIAVPSAPGTMRARVLSACRARGIPVRTLPTTFELLQGSPGVLRQVREVRVEDILGREPVRMELERVGRYLSGQVVMVTGAGGSIGSELCRQIARVAPRRLVLVDHAEDNLFEIVRELEDERHVRGVVPVLADCKEEERMREVFVAQRPDTVFHAAAYKHVGMMELNPVEAVRNNALATRLVARIAGLLGVGSFVLISTDKAVSPATVMGASKALGEWAVEAAAARHPETRYATVRFGNVLGSSGSVVPIFRRQIAAGGPVTVTDERMTRYFMTVPEAVQLVIRAGSLGRGAATPPDAPPAGALYVLDMGEPVRIHELAEEMVRLSGLQLDRDIAIEVVGRRPGEKLHEQLFNPYEHPQPTPAEKIRRAQRPPLEPGWVEETFDQINLLVLEGDAAGLAAKVAELAGARAAWAAAPASSTQV